MKISKNKGFVELQHRCIAAMVLLPEDDQMRIYVAWENRPAAEDHFMRFYKSPNTYNVITKEAIIEACDYGSKLRDDVAKEVFHTLFN